MNQPSEAQLVQKQLDEMGRLLVRAMMNIARTNKVQTSLTLRELTRLSMALSVRRPISRFNRPGSRLCVTYHFRAIEIAPASAKTTFVVCPDIYSVSLRRQTS